MSPCKSIIDVIGSEYPKRTVVSASIFGHDGELVKTDASISVDVADGTHEDGVSRALIVAAGVGWDVCIVSIPHAVAAQGA